MRPFFPPKKVEPGISEREESRGLLYKKISAAAVATNLIFIGLVANLFFIGLACFSLYQSRVLFKEQAEILSKNLSRVLAEEIREAVNKIDLGILSVTDEVERQLSGGKIDGRTLNAFITREVARVSILEGLRVVNAKGEHTYGTGVNPSTALISVADRAYFCRLHDDPKAGLVISNPVFGRVSRKWSIIMARRVNQPDGSFAGVVYASITLTRLSYLLSSIDIGDHGSVSLRGDDQTLFARYPTPPDGVELLGKGNMTDGSQNTMPDMRKVSGTYYTKQDFDKIPRLYSYHQVSTLPIFVKVGISKLDYLAAWWREFFCYLVLEAIFFSGTLLAVFFFYQNWKAKAKSTDRLIKSEALLRESQSISGLGSFETDLSSGRWTSSEVMDKLFGIGREYDRSVEGWLALVHPDDRAMMADYFTNEVLARRRDFDKEYRIIRRNDKCERWVHGLGKLEFDDHGRPVLMHGTIQDITDRKSLEAELRTTINRAESANRTKTEFLAVMSHELRTPLNGILGFAGLMLGEKSLPSDIRDNIAIIESSGRGLLRMLEDILEFSRVAGGGLKLQNIPFSPSAEAWKAVRLIESEAKLKQLELFVKIGDDVPGTVLGDPDRIQQVMLNLLRNAIKFTEQGTITLIIRLSSRERDVYRVYFAVEDTGSGIPESEREHIFLPFTQGDNSLSRKYNGVGIGLTISKRLLEKMGTSISLKSQMGRGSIFSFELSLPAATSTKMDTVDGVVDLGDLNKGFAKRFPVRILIVEDNPVNLQLAVMLLGKLGYEKILTATSGEEALDLVASEQVDLVFMDLQMPGIDGLEATRRIRSFEAGNSSLSSRKIVALTANASPSIRNECFEAGMNHYISKPFNTRSLAEAIAL